MRKLLMVLIGVGLLAYPLLVWFGLQKWGVRLLAPFLLVLFIVRLAQTRTAGGDYSFVKIILPSLGILLVALAWIFRANQWLFFYPVVANALFLGAFAFSLYKPPSFCESFARLIHKENFPESAIPYARRVTQIWCLLFLFNGSVALFTCLHGDVQLWTLYNGVIAYVLIGTLFAGEWLVRKILFKN